MTQRDSQCDAQRDLAEVTGPAEPLVVFAYGSLLFRPGFEYVKRLPAVVRGYARSFSQGSPDHRGTSERPGRVLTLAARADAICAGAVYLVASPFEQLLLDLDHRERAGYQRTRVNAWSEGRTFEAVTWIAPPGNPHDVGELELEALAGWVAAAAGPSGRNDAYVFELERELATLGVVDPLISDLAALLRAQAKRGPNAG